MRFRFIEDRRADYPVTILCDVLAVSPAGYYAWRSRPESRRSAANRKLVDDIKQVHRDTCGRYGSPRIHAELKAQGRGVSRGRIERLMRHHGIRAIMARPRRVRTTDSRHDFPIAANLLERNFTAAAPNRIWLADITYIETDQGWLYLATVMDLYSRRIVGWSGTTRPPRWAPARPVVVGPADAARRRTTSRAAAAARPERPAGPAPRVLARRLAA